MIRVERLDWEGEDPAAMAMRMRAMVAPLPELGDEVREIIDRIRADGDAAVRRLAERLGDEVPERFRVDPEAIAAAPGLLDPELREALRLAADNVARVAASEVEGLRRAAVAEPGQGQRVEVRHEPVSAAGIYVPGGRAAYPSSALMCCVPARAAGVGRVAVATPPGPGGRPGAAVLAACAIAGVDEVYAIGGAQAIAALAFGTESVPAVDVIAGPGNRYVTEAKRLVAGVVGIDGLAGPSELMIVADGGADPRLLALDLCAQAEHGDDSPLALVSPDRALLDRVAELVDEVARERPSVSAAPLALVATSGVGAALELADAFAPEHLQLDFEGADATAARARVAGCVFVGAGGATAFGDYTAGSNHVLPTGGGARFAGPLGPGAFMRRTSVVSVSQAAAAAMAPHVEAMASAEGLPVHGESASARAGG